MSQGGPIKGRLGAGNSKKTKVNEPMVKNPKRPLTAYTCYVSEIRKLVMTCHMSTPPQLSTHFSTGRGRFTVSFTPINHVLGIAAKVGKSWKDLDPKLKQGYDERAKQDKLRFKREKETQLKLLEIMNLQKEELGEGDTGSVANLNDLLHAATGNISHDRTESPGKGANFKSREELESTLIISSEYKSASTEPKQASSTKKRKLSSESRADPGGSKGMELVQALVPIEGVAIEPRGGASGKAAKKPALGQETKPETSNMYTQTDMILSDFNVVLAAAGRAGFGLEIHDDDDLLDQLPHCSHN